MSFNSALFERLKTGSIKNVLLFGDGMGRYKKPYAVVRPMAGGDRKLYQIIAHMDLGMQDSLEAYMLCELPELLKAPLESGGKQTTARSTGAWAGPYADESDNSIWMSRDFYIPVIL